MVTEVLRVIKNNVWRKFFIKGLKYRKIRPIDLEKSKCCILEDLNNFILSSCCKNVVDKTLFSEWSNIFSNYTDGINIHIRIQIKYTYKNSYSYKNTDWLSSTDLKNALYNIHKNFVVVPIDEATGSIALICTILYASAIATELGLNNSSSSNTYNKINNLSENDIIGKYMIS